MTGERPRPAETVVEAVILSLVNQLVYRLGFFWLPPELTAAQNGQLALLFEVLILPAVLGGLSGWFVSRNWVPDGVRRLVLPLTRPVPQSYEQAFTQVDMPCYVIVSFDDGREVLGLFASKSFAGADPVHGGIFIERLYTIGDDDEWRPVEPQRSAWLSLRNVRSIEFFDR